MQGRDGGDMLPNDQMMGGPGVGGLTHQMRGMNLGQHPGAGPSVGMGNQESPDRLASS